MCSLFVINLSAMNVVKMKLELLNWLTLCCWLMMPDKNSRDLFYVVSCCWQITLRLRGYLAQCQQKPELEAYLSCLSIHESHLCGHDISVTPQLSSRFGTNIHWLNFCYQRLRATMTSQNTVLSLWMQYHKNTKAVFQGLHNSWLILVFT